VLANNDEHVPNRVFNGPHVGRMNLGVLLEIKVQRRKPVRRDGLFEGRSLLACVRHPVLTSSQVT
jgi:hypothetical protein